jgi:hypothetical protein
VPLLLAVDAVETTWRTDNYATAHADLALQDGGFQALSDGRG